MQQRRTIPPEVTDLIIACVGLDDYDDDRRRTLLACALVCSNWLPASRRELFRRVRFGRQDASPERFLQMDLHSQFMQHRLSYISEMHFVNLELAVSHSSYIHRLVGHIPSLETLIFYNLNWCDPLWHPSTFIIFSGFPMLHNLTLQECIFPSLTTLRHMLSAVSRLASLTMEMVDWPRPKPLNLPSRDVPRRRPALASLTVYIKIERQAELLQWLCTTSTIHSIKHIHFDGVLNGEDGHDDFLRMSAPSIRELHCEAEGTTRQSHPSDFEWLIYRNMTHFSCLTDLRMLAQHIPHMINLEKLIVDIGPGQRFRTVCWDLSHTLQDFAGQHFQEILMERIEGEDLDSWTEALWGLGGEIASDDDDKNHPDAAFRPLEQILTRENMAQTAVVFVLSYHNRKTGDRFRLALQSKLPELYKHCVFEYEQ